MAIYQLTGSNALDVSSGVEEVIKEFEEVMPVGMTIQKIYDNTEFVEASIDGVTTALREAVVLVVLILFLFLQNWKATLVPAIAIPVALVGTFLFVLAFGFTLNQLTLFGLVLAAGLVVDDAITIIEDTSTKKASGLSALESAKSTMDELFAAVIATSLVLFAVFVPVLFFPGATGTIYKQFAATIIFSILISTFNALTFSPMLSALLLARESEPPAAAPMPSPGCSLVSFTACSPVAVALWWPSGFWRWPRGSATACICSRDYPCGCPSPSVVPSRPCCWRGSTVALRC